MDPTVPTSNVNKDLTLLWTSSPCPPKCSAVSVSVQMDLKRIVSVVGSFSRSCEELLCVNSSQFTKLKISFVVFWLAFWQELSSFSRVHIKAIGKPCLLSACGGFECWNHAGVCWRCYAQGQLGQGALAWIVHFSNIRASRCLQIWLDCTCPLRTSMLSEISQNLFCNRLYCLVHRTMSLTRWSLCCLRFVEWEVNCAIVCGGLRTRVIPPFALHKVVALTFSWLHRNPVKRSTMHWWKYTCSFFEDSFPFVLHWMRRKVFVSVCLLALNPSSFQHEILQFWQKFWALDKFGCCGQMWLLGKLVIPGVPFVEADVQPNSFVWRCSTNRCASSRRVLVSLSAWQTCQVHTPDRSGLGATVVFSEWKHLMLASFTMQIGCFPQFVYSCGGALVRRMCKNLGGVALSCLVFCPDLFQHIN